MSSPARLLLLIVVVPGLLATDHEWQSAAWAQQPVPQSDALGNTPSNSSIEFQLAGAERIVYRRAGEPELALHLFRPPTATGPYPIENPRATIVFFFGGGWHGGTPLQFAPQAQALAARGMVAICAEYRVRSRHQSVPWHSVADAKAAVRFVRQHASDWNIDPYRIAVAGGSAGGHLAACTVTAPAFAEEESSTISCEPDALILLNPVVDTTELGYGAQRFGERAREFSPVHHVRPRIAPTLILHGRADTTVPWENVERFAREMAAHGNACELVGYDGAEHGFFNPGRAQSQYDDTLARIDDFLTQLGFLLPQANDVVAGRSLVEWQSLLMNQESSLTLRRLAARQLGVYGIAAVDTWETMLDDSDPSIRYWGAKHFGNIDPVSYAAVFTPARTAQLVRGLSDPDQGVRMANAFALCRTSERDKGLQLLREAVEGTDRPTAHAAADLLGSVGPTARPVASAMRTAMSRQQSSGDFYHVAGGLMQALRKIERIQSLDDSSRPTGGAAPREWVASETPPAAEPTTTTTASDARPNILWISCEDISPNLGCYGDSYASTPNLDQLAREGTRFTRAFTPAGVCAVVRSGIITGIYPISLGSLHMRSRIKVPDNVQCFTEYLRQAGYFCTNKSKTDYQFEPPKSAWDRQGEGHGDWRDRAPGQPFFSVINLTGTHESQIRHGVRTHEALVARLLPAQRHDPDQAVESLPPIHADSPEARTDWAWYADNISDMDRQVGSILQKLEQDGLADNTIVMFWSDHGRGLPRGKRWIYDSGTHIPFIVRWPGELAADTLSDDLISTQDLPATVLALAGIARPDYMQGRVCLGPEADDAPEYLFFHRDRMDEACETMRGVRDSRYKYIRNFEPERTYLQHIEYMDKMPTLGVLRQRQRDGQLTFAQGIWFRTRKPMEEFYDLEQDPHETVNLVGQTEHQSRIAAMRMALESWQVEVEDQGMVPEAIMMQRMR